MHVFGFLNEVTFTLYEMILFWIVSYTVIHFYLSTVLRGINVASVVRPVATNNDQLVSAVSLEELKFEVDEKIREQKLYARPQLNIERMAQLLDLPTRQLSLLIKTEFHQTYFEFINYYRLMAAKERLVNDEWAESSVQNIYESVGFVSRSTFFTAFKKQEGITPAEYRCKYRTQTQLD